MAFGCAGRRAGWYGTWCLLALALATLGSGLGTSRRLSYHEAIVAQGALEMCDAGDWLIPTLDGRPWLEKPPLAHWLVAALGTVSGRIDEGTARIPSALAAFGIALVVASMAARRYGHDIGLLAGLVQLTTAWTIQRGRLADADIHLAFLIAVTVLAYDRVREIARELGSEPEEGRRRLCAWRWAFFGLLGATSMAKGLGFGAVLILGTVAACTLWDRDSRTTRALVYPPGWLLSLAIASAWPLAVIARYPEAIDLWFTHIRDRLGSESAHFAGEPTWQVMLSPLTSTLPWSPMALFGLGIALQSARRDPESMGHPSPTCDHRLLLCWAVVPIAMLSCATVKNEHYLIHALPPWAIGAALGLSRIGRRLREHRGLSRSMVRRLASALFVALGLGVGVGFATLGPIFDDRGREWAWYAEAAAHVDPDRPLALLYDEWDRLPYPTPFGPVPHDLAVRLFYLRRPARTYLDPQALLDDPPDASTFHIIARARDLPTLLQRGRVTPILQSPDHRWDRTYLLFRIEKPHRSH